MSNASLFTGCQLGLSRGEMVHACSGDRVISVRASVEERLGSGSQRSAW
jgi:hypothetical protein